jgi:hypothetical protein
MKQRKAKLSPIYLKYSRYAIVFVFVHCQMHCLFKTNQKRNSLTWLVELKLFDFFDFFVHNFITWWISSCKTMSKRIMQSDWLAKKSPGKCRKQSRFLLIGPTNDVIRHFLLWRLDTVLYIYYPLEFCSGSITYSNSGLKHDCFYPPKENCNHRICNKISSTVCTVIGFGKMGSKCRKCRKMSGIWK